MDEVKKIRFNISDSTRSDKKVKEKKEDFSKLTEALNGGIVQDGDTIQIYSYKLNGKIKTTANENEKIAGKIYEQINRINLFNKNTPKELQKINSDNVLEIINEYDKISPNQTLLEAIIEKCSTDENAGKEYLVKPLIERIGSFLESKTYTVSTLVDWLKSFSTLSNVFSPGRNTYFTVLSFTSWTPLVISS